MHKIYPKSSSSDTDIRIRLDAGNIQIAVLRIKC